MSFTSITCSPCKTDHDSCAPCKDRAGGGRPGATDRAGGGRLHAGDRAARRTAAYGLGPGPSAACDSRAGRGSERLLQVVLELAASGWVAQLAQRLGLDLADALTGDVEFLADLLERPGAAVFKPEPELEHPPL